MKIFKTHPRSFLTSAASNPIRWVGCMLAATVVSGADLVSAATWTGNTSTDWNTSTNWSGTFGSAVINSIPPNVPTITANISPIPTSTFVGSTGAAKVNHISGNASVSPGNDLILGRSAGSNGTYNLADTGSTGGTLTGFGQGSGNLTIPDQIYVGGGIAAGTGTLNVHTTGTVSVGTDLLLGNFGGTGTVKIDSGTVTVGSDLTLGNGTTSSGTFSMSGGSFTKTANGSTGVFIGGSSTTSGLSGGTGTFNLSGGTFTSGSLVNIGNRPSSTGTLNVSGGTFTANGVLNVGYQSTSSGTLAVSGGTLNTNSDLQVGSFTGATGSVEVSGGTMNSAGWVVIGRRDGSEGAAVGGVGHVVMHGGTWNKTGTSNFIVGAHGNGDMTMDGGLVVVVPDPAADRGVTWVGEQNNCTGVLTISGTAEFRSESFTMGVQTGTNGTLNLDGGTVKTTQFNGGAGTSTISFNGTQIIATGDNAAFINAIGTATLNSGGLKVDSDGFDLSTNQYLGGTGGVVKSGSGTLALNFANDYSGDTEVQGGKLVISSQYFGSGNVIVADGATLGVLEDIDISAWINDMTLGSSGDTSLDIDLGNAFGNPAAPAIDVVGNLAVNGTVTINIMDANPDPGSFDLIHYVAKTGTGHFELGEVPSGVQATLTDESGAVTLHINDITFPKWTGEADIGNPTGIWDTSTQNWIDIVSSIPSFYVEGAPVVFDDTATGPTTIELNDVLSPGGVRFDNYSLPYSIDGTGGIAGSYGLTKYGTADLTLGTANTFTGPVELNGGTTYIDSVSSGGSPGSLGSGTSAVVLGGGNLNYTGPAASMDRGLAVNALGATVTHANDLNIAGRLTSSNGNLVKDGAGKLTLSYPGSNALSSLASNVLVHAGALMLEGGGTQTNSVFGEIWVADQPDIPADLIIHQSSLTTGNWLAIGRGNGDAGVTHLTATDSTITTVNFSTGFDNGLANNASEAFVSLHNTIWTNNGLTYLAESQGSTAEMTLTGNSQFNINNNFLLARNAATCTATVTLSDTSSITKTGGYTSIGTNGTGTMTVRNNASFTSLTGDFNVSDVGTSVGVLNLQDSGVINVTNVYIGKNTGTTGTYNQTGGTFNSAAFVSVGRYYSGIGTLNVSGGTFTSTTPIILGEQGGGTLNVSGTAVVTSGGDALYIGGGPNNYGGTGALNLNGGTVIAKKLSEGVVGTSSVVFNGGLLKAAAGAASSFVSGLDSAVIQSGGARIDTNGQNLIVAQILSGGGGLIKSGTGTLTLSGANTYTGPTSVTAGTLAVSTAFFADTSAISISSGAVLNLTHGVTDHVGSLTINGSAMPAGLYDSTTSPGYITGTGKLQVAGIVTSPYDTWISGFPSIPLADRDPGDDPDNDGFSNAMEFALGGIPNDGSDNPKVYSLIADSSADGDTTSELVMTIAVRSGTPAFAGSPSPTATMDGFTYRAEGGTTLTGFTVPVSPVNPVTAGLPGAPAGYEYRSFSLSGSNGTPGAGFLRAGVVTP